MTANPKPSHTRSALRHLKGAMFRLPGIRHVRTNMVLREIKSTVALPFDDG